MHASLGAATAGSKGSSISTSSTSAGVPTCLQVVGRDPCKENGDMCGEYVLSGREHCGRAVYQKPGTCYNLRCCGNRWVFDRGGSRDFDGVAVAYADDRKGVAHPAHLSLVWYVWEAAAKRHVQDTSLLVLDAPRRVFLVGRAHCKPNGGSAGVNGEYVLRGAWDGQPLYRQLRSRTGGGIVLQYAKEQRRWYLIAPDAKNGNLFLAYADQGAGLPSDGFASLRWTFCESVSSSGDCAWEADTAVHVLDAPQRVHVVVGRHAGAEKTRIEGTYYLAGAHDGRPVYVQPGTQKVLRYAASSDRWLIDCEGLQEPSLLSRIYQWAFAGDSSDTADKCTAFSEAHGTPHPGFSALSWQIWDVSAKRHAPDLLVCSTMAPLKVHLAGRGPEKENHDIVGAYVLVAGHQGRPAYQRVSDGGASTETALRCQRGRWVVDRGGLRDSDLVAAYAEHPVALLARDREHPADSRAKWYVYDASRGMHLPDPNVKIIIPQDAPTQLPVLSTRKAASPPPPIPNSWQSEATSELKASRKRGRIDVLPTPARAADATRVVDATHPILETHLAHATRARPSGSALYAGRPSQAALAVPASHFLHAGSADEVACAPDAVHAVAGAYVASDRVVESAPLSDASPVSAKKRRLLPTTEEQVSETSVSGKRAASEAPGTSSRRWWLPRIFGGA